MFLDYEIGKTFQAWHFNFFVLGTQGFLLFLLFCSVLFCFHSHFAFEYVYSRVPQLCWMKGISNCYRIVRDRVYSCYQGSIGVFITVFEGLTIFCSIYLGKSLGRYKEIFSKMSKMWLFQLLFSWKRCDGFYCSSVPQYHRCKHCYCLLG